MPGAAPDLPTLLEEDGHTLIQNGGEWKLLCPFHDEKTPSFTVFDKGDKWRAKCFGCGWNGDAADYLQEARGMSERDALRAVNGEIAPGTANSQPQTRRPAREPPAKEKAPLLQRPPRADVTHVYRDAKGTAVLAICRYEATPDLKKYFVPYTREKGGWRRGLTLKPRPLYRLPELVRASKAARVLVVEGEKCADAAAAFAPTGIVTTWPSGGKSWKHADWSPVYGHPLTLAADGDAVGHDTMRELAEHLSPHCPNITLSLPPIPEDGKGEDIADVLATRHAEARSWLRAHSTPYVRPQPPESRTQQPLAETAPQNGSQSVSGPRMDFLNSGNLAFRPRGRDVNGLRFDVGAGERKAKTVLPGQTITKGELLTTLAPRSWWAKRLEYALTAKAARLVADTLKKPRRRRR